MEIESLFSSTRWDIIQALSKGKMSPMQLAERLNTTSANVSQQLRLLELGGLVKSEKTSNVEKGKPRILYSLSGDSAFLIMASPNFADKKMISLTKYHKFMMRSWFLDNTDHHHVISQVYENLEGLLPDIRLIAAASGRTLELDIVTAKKSAVKKALSELKVRVNFHDSLKMDESMIVLHNSEGIIGEVVNNG